MNSLLKTQSGHLTLIELMKPIQIGQSVTPIDGIELGFQEYFEKEYVNYFANRPIKRSRRNTQRGSQIAPDSWEYLGPELLFPETPKTSNNHGR